MIFLVGTCRACGRDDIAEVKTSSGVLSGYRCRACNTYSSVSDIWGISINDIRNFFVREFLAGGETALTQARRLVYSQIAIPLRNDNPNLDRELIKNALRDLSAEVRQAYGRGPRGRQQQPPAGGGRGGITTQAGVWSPKLGGISGQVHRIVDGEEEGIGGARVIVLGTRFSAVTDQDGYYEIGGMPARTYKVVARVPGFKDKVRENVVLTPDVFVDVSFKMEEEEREVERPRRLSIEELEERRRAVKTRHGAAGYRRPGFWRSIAGLFGIGGGRGAGRGPRLPASRRVRTPTLKEHKLFSPNMPYLILCIV
ncbi:MAG: carboxypeptidase regulatory-like domain-containing protein, partial [Candidatus Aenigmarchaeota archaeon]|nr:carboxypeptidase regulatory-like domain-containing protein [Candidatus Aenigmarchaeota archaeon]